MDNQAEARETIHAALIEVERGLFHATYRIEGPVSAARRLPPYQVGDSAADARRRIELCAVALGYGAVVWETPLPDPAFLGGAADHSAGQALKP